MTAFPERIPSLQRNFAHWSDRSIRVTMPHRFRWRILSGDTVDRLVTADCRSCRPAGVLVHWRQRGRSPGRQTTCSPKSWSRRRMGSRSRAIACRPACRPPPSTDVGALQPLDVTDLLNRGFGSVSINHAQNNPLQPDVNFRGQTASPLLGMAQGLSVYADGVRMNETFGDTVNWDLLPLSAVFSVQLLAGTNPVFGLNSLGGALSLTMKNGFNTQGTTADVLGGSFGRWSGSLQSGGNNGKWGWYGDLDYFDEDGWRDHSHSDALRGYGALSWRSGEDSFDLSYAACQQQPARQWRRTRRVAEHRSQGRVHVAGPDRQPPEPADCERFEVPRRRPQALRQSLLSPAAHKAASMAMARIFEACDVGGSDLLVDENHDGPDGEASCTDADNYDLVLDQNGQPIPFELEGEALNAINNISPARPDELWRLRADCRRTRPGRRSQERPDAGRVLAARQGGLRIGGRSCRAHRGSRHHAHRYLRRRLPHRRRQSASLPGACMPPIRSTSRGACR